MNCSICQADYIPKHKTQTTCLHPICKVESKKQQAKARAERRELRARKEKIKTRSDWLREAQQAVNEYVRWRDRADPCISCGRYHNGQWHAGHYRTTKAAPELRFTLLNIHKQCQPCNAHLSGNIVEYRINLIRKIGVEWVEWLEGPHEPAKLTIEEIKAVRDAFRRRLREEKRDEKEAA